MFILEIMVYSYGCQCLKDKVFSADFCYYYFFDLIDFGVNQSINQS